MKRQILTVAILCVLCFSGHLAMAGTIEGWGSNNDNLTADIPTDNDFTAVAIGDRHAFALKTDGTVVGWGDNSNNKLNVPADANNIVAIAAGLDFTLALKADGSIVGWGGSSFDSNRRITDIPTDPNYVAIAAGKWHGLAIRKDGSAVGWGYDIDGQSSGYSAGNDFMTLGGGTYHSAAVRGDGITGSIEAWGWFPPGVIKPAGSDFIAVDCGLSHSLALRADGTLSVWGTDTDGQVSETPTDGGYKAIATGKEFNIALKANGTLAAWGNDDDNQKTNVPVGNSFVAIAAGTTTGLAISEPGTLTLTSPNGAEVLKTGTMHTITWDKTGNITNVWIEYSTDNGANWLPVGPPNAGNTGSYEWLVPVATSQECLVRVRHSPIAITIEGTDQSDAPLTIFVCPLSGDITGDCVVDEADIAVIESQWHFSYDPFAEPVTKVDFNDDGSINAGDLMTMGLYWLEPDCGEFGCEGTNVDGIGAVDLRDLAKVGEYWGTSY